MQTKLTLRLDDRLIRRAKAQARKYGKSLSQMVADYFALLEEEEPEPIPDELPPTVKKWMGFLSGSGLDRDDYRDHLEEKHR